MKEIWIVWDGGGQWDEIFATKELAEKYISALGDINPVLSRDDSIECLEVHDNIWIVEHCGETDAVFATKEEAEEWINMRIEKYAWVIEDFVIKRGE